jgi:hypothetical protein
LLLVLPEYNTRKELLLLDKIENKLYLRHLATIFGYKISESYCINLIKNMISIIILLIKNTGIYIHFRKMGYYLLRIYDIKFLNK